MVLTAAHCKGSFAGQTLVGAYRKWETTNGAEWVGTRAEIRHPSYNDQDQRFDFMLVPLARTVNKRTIPTNGNAGFPVANAMLTTIGMGFVQESGPGSDLLRKVTVRHVPLAQCNSGAMYGGWVDGQTMLCASSPGKDSCYGT
jgi:secreted trypsin-like serine protease